MCHASQNINFNHFSHEGGYGEPVIHRLKSGVCVDWYIEDDISDKECVPMLSTKKVFVHLQYVHSG